MTTDRETAVSSGASAKLDRFLKNPSLRVVIGFLEVLAVVAALVMLFLTAKSLMMTFDERDDRKESRSFRAWGIVLDTTEMVLSGEENLVHADPAYKDIVSRITADALEFLNEYRQSLHGVVLPYTNLSGIDLTDATLSGSNFTGANLSNARLSYADFKGATLVDADLTGADLECAINLSQPQLDQACADPSKKAPFLKTEPCRDGKEDEPERQALKWNPRPCPDSGSAAK